MILAMIGTTELLLIGGLVLLLFGGKKLPEMMRGLGQGVREFKKGVNEINPELDEKDKAAEVSEFSQDFQEKPETPNDGEERE